MMVDGSDDIVLIDDSKLSRVNSRKPIFRYLHDIWDRRHFLVGDARARSFSTGRNTFLGRLWLFLDPIFQIAIYALVFGFIINTSRGIDNFIGFLAIGVTVFQSITRGYNSGVGVIQSSRALISSFRFPRIIVVISRVVQNWLTCSIPVLVGIISALLFQIDKGIPATVILALPLYVVLLIFIMGLSFIFARITAFIPDMRSVINLGTRGLFFVSGIFFTLDRFPEDSLVRQIMAINPVYQFLDVFRSVAMWGNLPSISSIAYLTGWSFLLFIFGFIFFWRAEERYAHVK